MEGARETETPIITKKKTTISSYSPSSSPSLKQKFKSSLTCFPSPFRHHHHHPHPLPHLPFSPSLPTSPASTATTTSLTRTSSTSVSRADATHHVTLDQIKAGGCGGGGKCKPFIPCIGGAGGGGRHRRRRTLSADFKYDELSYALNFDDGDGREDDFTTDDDPFRFRSFSSRLPPSPAVERRDNGGSSSTASSAANVSLSLGVSVD